MNRHPLEPTLPSAGNSDDSRATTLLRKPNPDHLRSHSFDEGNSGSRVMSSSHEEPDENKNSASSELAALHSSFDVALLDTNSNESIFSGRADEIPSTPQTKSWDDNDIDRGSDPALGELSGRKHLRQHAPTTEFLHPGTVRKLPRRSNSSLSTSDTKPSQSTAKPKIGSATPTPVSQRRYRTPFHHRKSPIRKGPPFNRVVPSTTKSPRLFPHTLTPTETAATPFPATVVKESARSHNTGITAETYADTDSHCTSSPSATSTPFRFTSFPASLPRVNNPRSADRGFSSPVTDSVKKRMTFAEDHRDGARADDSGERHPHRCRPPPQSLASHCREDDGTHNSSMSSWSAEGGQHMAYSAPSVPPTVLEWKSPINEHDMDTASMGNKGTGHRSLGSDIDSPVHAKKFFDENGCSRNHEDAAHFGDSVGRTRLNFNLVMSPDQQLGTGSGHARDSRRNSEEAKHGLTEQGREWSRKLDLSKPYEHRRVNSFPSPVSSNTPLRNVSGCDESATASTTAFTPSRSGGGSGPLGARPDSGRPRTPEEVQIHFQLDAGQCSPILGIHEDEGVDAVMTASKLEPRRLTRTPATNALDAKLHLSSSNDSSGSSTSSSKMRKLRPMPDISAFDTAGISGGSSQGEKQGVAASNPPPLPKLLCPPTPVRTPAWAQVQKGSTPVFTRTNSLIVTKVLATCPKQVLDGHSSLENSEMEDVENASATMEHRRASLSFATVEEETEGTSVSDRNSNYSDGLADLPLEQEQEADVRLRNLLHHETEASKPNPSLERVSFLRTPAMRGSLHRGVEREASRSGQEKANISFAGDFENLGELGKGAFADVFKVRSRSDNHLYAIKKNRRRFRGKRDRDMALAEVRTMQRLQSVCADTAAFSEGSSSAEERKRSLYLLFFFQAWQEDGYFFCQTELCCRDTCREMIRSLRSEWDTAKKNYPSLLKNLSSVSLDEHEQEFNTIARIIPDFTMWRICHDVAAGLSFIHRHNVVHNDIKPSNVFLVSHPRLGAMCKIGDFGMAGNVGTTEDGQEGDTLYMAPELLSSVPMHPSADMFSLGLTLYELATDISYDLPSEGHRWHQIRSGSHMPEFPKSRSRRLSELVQALINPDPLKRPSADTLLDVREIAEAGSGCDEFLKGYIEDIFEFDQKQDRRRQLERRLSAERGQTPRTQSDGSGRVFTARTPTPVSFYARSPK